MEDVLKRVKRLVGHMRSGVELGFHLCWGYLGHVHFVQPESTQLMVDLANGIVESLGQGRAVAYFHMPVPKDREDAEYFAPLNGLRIEKGTTIILGLVHPDDFEGSERRLETAKAVYPQVGCISSECGLGRCTPEETENTMKTYAALVGSQ